MKKKITLILLFCMSIFGFAQEFTGDWKGTLDVPFLELIVASEGGYFAFTVGVSSSALSCSRCIGYAKAFATRRWARGSGARAAFV